MVGSCALATIGWRGQLPCPSEEPREAWRSPVTRRPVLDQGPRRPDLPHSPGSPLPSQPASGPHLAEGGVSGICPPQPIGAVTPSNFRNLDVIFIWFKFFLTCKITPK